MGGVGSGRPRRGVPVADRRALMIRLRAEVYYALRAEACRRGRSLSASVDEILGAALCATKEEKQS